jgi:hypothetical protein
VIKVSDRYIPVFGIDVGRIARIQGALLCQQARLPRAVAPITGIARQISAYRRLMPIQKLGGYLALGFSVFHEDIKNIVQFLFGC